MVVERSREPKEQCKFKFQLVESDSATSPQNAAPQPEDGKRPLEIAKPAGAGDIAPHVANTPELGGQGTGVPAAHDPAHQEEGDGDETAALRAADLGPADIVDNQNSNLLPAGEQLDTGGRRGCTRHS